MRTDTVLKRLVLLLVFICGPAALLAPGQVSAEEEPHSAMQENVRWRSEFADLASKTLEASNLSDKELRSLLERCAALKPLLQGLEETPRKIYLGRLEKTESLFLYVLKSRDAEERNAQ